MGGLGKTAWVDRHLGLNWERVRAAVPKEDWLPLVTESSKGRAKVSFEEYGCGHYGCVMPTYDSDVVFKLTSDETEAFFVAAALNMKDDEAWAGLTEYYGIYRLRGAFHRKRPLYVLWREAAHDVGIQALETLVRADYYKQRQLRELTGYLEAFKWSANEIRKRLTKSKDPYALVGKSEEFEDWAWGNVEEYRLVRTYGGEPRVPSWAHSRGAQAVAAHLRHCQLIAELMEHTAGSSYIGESLGFFLGRGLLLADVHANNIGNVTREDFFEPITVITDPGHAVPLIPEWDSVTIEEI